LLTGAKRAIPVMAMLAIVAFASLLMMPALSQQRQSSNGRGEEPPTIITDVFSFSQDELIASVAGEEPGQSRNGGGSR
jgi:hypothetical protein